MKQVKVKRKFNKKALIVILLILYLIIMSFYYVWTLPIKKIIIKGNNAISDTEIIKKAGIFDYPRMFKYSSNKIKNNILEIEGIKSVKVKKSFLGNIELIINELDPLFYIANSKEYVFSDGSFVNCEKPIVGVPVLVNYVPDDIMESLIKKMAKVDLSIISKISEIEYAPNVKDNITIDAYRFFLRMNDGNQVNINLPNFENISRYEDMYTVLDPNVKGILKLDIVDSNFKNFSFKAFDMINNNENDGGSNELPQ